MSNPASPEGSSSADRRVRRTHQTLREALVGLILERGWDALSVRDICERANVGRSTFYTHFADKEELLVHSFANLRQGLHQPSASPQPTVAAKGGSQGKAATDAPPRTAAAELAPPLAFLHGLIAHVTENLRLAQATASHRTGLFVHVQFRRMLLDLFDQDLARFVPPGPAREAATHFLAGAFFEMLTWWLDVTRRPHEPADLEQKFLELARPVVTVLRRTASRPS